MYIPRNWEFGSALAKLRNFGGCLTPKPLSPHCTPLFGPVVRQTAKWMIQDRITVSIPRRDKVSLRCFSYIADLRMKFLSILTVVAHGISNGLLSWRWVLVNCGGKERLVQVGQVGEVACGTLQMFQLNTAKLIGNSFPASQNKNLHLHFKAQRINLLVTRCTNKWNIQQLYVLPTLYLCVL
jgi:hypothetical protein